MIILSKEQLELLNKKVNEYIKPIIEYRNSSYPLSVSLKVEKDDPFLFTVLHMPTGERVLETNLIYVLNVIEEFKIEIVEEIIKGIISIELLKTPNMIEDVISIPLEVFAKSLDNLGIKYDITILEISKTIIDMAVQIGRAKFCENKIKDLVSMLL